MNLCNMWWNLTWNTESYRSDFLRAGQAAAGAQPAGKYFQPDYQHLPVWFLSWTAEQWTVDQQQATAGKRKYSCSRKTPGPLESCEQGEWVGSNAVRSLAGVFTNNPYIIWLNCQSSTKNVAEISLNPLCLELFTCTALLKTNPEYNWHDNNNCVPHTSANPKSFPRIWNLYIAHNVSYKQPLSSLALASSPLHQMEQSSCRRHLHPKLQNSVLGQQTKPSTDCVLWLAKSHSPSALYQSPVAQSLPLTVPSSYSPLFSPFSLT